MPGVHEYVGRPDRLCEVPNCGEADRAPIHRYLIREPVSAKAGFGRVVGKAQTWSPTRGNAEGVRIEMKPGEWVPDLGDMVLLSGRPDGGSLSVFDGDRADIDAVLTAAEELWDHWRGDPAVLDLGRAVNAYRKGK